MKPQNNRLHDTKLQICLTLVLSAVLWILTCVIAVNISAFIIVLIAFHGHAGFDIIGLLDANISMIERVGPLVVFAVPLYLFLVLFAGKDGISQWFIYSMLLALSCLLAICGYEVDTRNIIPGFGILAGSLITGIILLKLRVFLY
jgi:hypothetical protein